MRELIVMALAGFAASLVDGALGMGFGPTSSSILLGSGLTPAAAATTVNLAKVFTGLAGAVSHWRFGNVNRRLVFKLAIPGVGGALVGVTVLSHVDGATLKPILAGLLSLIGLRILWRFTSPTFGQRPDPRGTGGEAHTVPSSGIAGFDERGVEFAAAAGGVTNGMIGAWGPVVTPFLMQRGLTPRYAVGSVNTAEVAVASMSATSLLAALGGGELKVSMFVAMLVGGFLAAPVAAWSLRFIPARMMGVGVASLLLLTNAQQLSVWAQLGSMQWVAYGAVAALVVIAGLRPRLRRAIEALQLSRAGA